MEFTGERMIPEINKGGVTYLEHMTRYFFASQFVKNKIVLDIACGSGYGSKIISDRGAKFVTGVDISEEAILYCKQEYANESIDFIKGGVERIPLGDGSVDVVVSFETIEHVSQDMQKTFLKEVKRVLKKDGVFIVSTPNALVYPKGNEFHVYEMSPSEFRSALNEQFKENKMYYQDDVACSYILPEKNVTKTFFIDRVDLSDVCDSEYMIAVCSDGDNGDLYGYVGLSNWKPYKEPIIHIQESANSSYLMQQKDFEINFMKSSKFWKLRNRYVQLKSGINFAVFSPVKFIKKYFKI